MRLIDAERFEELFNQQVELGATDLFDVVEAGDGSSSGPRFVQCRQQQGAENRQDCNNNQ